MGRGAVFFVGFLGRANYLSADSGKPHGVGRQEKNGRGTPPPRVALYGSNLSEGSPGEMSKDVRRAGGEASRPPDEDIWGRGLNGKRGFDGFAPHA